MILVALNPIIILHFVGVVWIALGLSFLACLIPAIYYNEPGITLILTIGISLIVCGLATRLFPKPMKGFQSREALLSVALAWVSAGLLGALPYYFSGLTSFTDAVFETVSGFTTTGASIFANVEILPHWVLLWRAITHCLGGMGIVVMSVAILPMIGYGGVELFQTESVGPLKEKLTPRIRETARLLWGVYLGIIAFEVILLRFGGMNWFESVCHSFATVATGGFSTRNASIGAFNSTYINWVVIIFMIAGGANFALHIRAFRGKPLTYWKDYEFKYWLSVILGAMILITVINYFRGHDIVTAFQGASFTAVCASTTTGFVTQDYDTWTSASLYILFLLLFIGSCGGSTGGSIKVFRWAVATKSVRLHMRRSLHRRAVIPLRIGGKIVPDDTIRSIHTYVIAYFLMVAIGTLILTVIGLEFDTALFGVASCASSFGPGINDLGATETYASLPDLAKQVLIVIMLLGRLEIFAIITLFTRGFWRP